MKTITSVMALSLACLFSACHIVTVKYSGEELAPTKHVDLLFSLQDTDKKYVVIGQGVVIAEDQTISNEIQNAIITKAEQVGANAVVITNYNIIPQQASLDGDPGYDTYTPGYPIHYQPNNYWSDGGTGLNDSLPMGPMYHDEYYYAARIKLLFLEYTQGY